VVLTLSLAMMMLGQAVPPAGWAQILLFASALEVLAPQSEDKVPGNVQVRWLAPLP
jgi:hypothetical protein